MIIGLIGLGEMGSEIGRYLVMNDLEVISVFEGRSDLSKKRALNYGIKDAGSIEKLCMKSDIILSKLRSYCKPEQPPLLTFTLTLWSEE